MLFSRLELHKLGYGAFHCAGHVTRDRADAESLRRVHVDGTQA